MTPTNHSLIPQKIPPILTYISCITNTHKEEKPEINSIYQYTNIPIWENPNHSQSLNDQKNTSNDDGSKNTNNGRL